MFKVSGLSCYRNEQELFSNLTFELGSGSLLVVIGTNGSGKSSLLKILAGLLLPKTGKLYWKEEPLSLMNAYFLSDLIYLGHATGISLALTPFENLKCESSLKDEAIKSILNKWGLSGFSHKPCYTLSAGLKQKVALARLGLTSAKLWLLDEPFTALDKSGQALFLEHLSCHLRNKGMAVIASHVPIDLKENFYTHKTLMLQKHNSILDNTVC